ncbi:Rrf2 family transcriptional regulator [Polaromonas sp. UC242_47]|uniref:Rrf2 family transcriptional regulator n=1 Tax=Polaromonas sp. UC242_47 TaxID=3374626 RepID=UPI00379E51DF
MQIATKGRVAVIAMLELALRIDHKPVALVNISARQKISLSYLELLFGRLRRQGLVRSARGPGGGYSLARDAVDINMADIVLAVDEPGRHDPRAVISSVGAGHPRGQRIASDWHADLERTMVEFLASVSLQDLAESQGRLGPGAASCLKSA